MIVNIISYRDFDEHDYFRESENFLKLGDAYDLSND